MKLTLGSPMTQEMCAESDHQVGTTLLTNDDTPIEGSGPCKACDCRGYIPNKPPNDYCKNCQHSWYMHESV